MKLVFASDSFKGSLSSAEIVNLLSRAAKEVLGEVECIGIPVADGGEGTVDSILSTISGSKISTEVCGPLGDRIKAYYGKLDEIRAIIEMASASGLTLISKDKRNPLYTSTYGTGELIKDAFDKGFRDIYIAIGGSATNDGGMGCARALGIRFLDKTGNEVDGVGADLDKVERIDLSGLDTRIKDSKFTVLCDVKNPLCGPNGATYTFAAQKGADPVMQDRLEKGMCNYRDVIRRQFGIDPDSIIGGGAAGGLGTMLKVFLNAEMKPGIETVLELVHFDSLINNADLIITGEGCTDWQSSFGKVVCGVGERAKKKGIPVIDLCGSLGDGYEEIYNHGITSLITTVNAPMSLEEAMKNAKDLYYKAAVRLFRMLKMSK
ncbi:MAG: glycerate kinase [Lachnospiraceae bacterium]|nr:glycerate kinase [Lachnospiraceae bacterium]